ncbi:MAG: RtcB family protein, partial [Rhodospirillales bacterium]
MRCGLIIQPPALDPGASSRSRSSVTALEAVVAWNRGACEDDSPNRPEPARVRRRLLIPAHAGGDRPAPGACALPPAEHLTTSVRARGAGRRLSRAAAKKRFSLADLEAQMGGVVYRHSKAFIDEIPAAYKDIDEVMENAKELVTIEHT